MRWEDERYVRVYTRDTADWLALSWDAQALFMQLLRKVDRAGLLPLGRQGKRAVAIALGQVALWEERLAPALEELLADGCVVIHDDVLVVRNFTEAQEAKQSDAHRKREQRSRARDKALAPVAVTKRDNASRNVTESHEVSAPVTAGHTASQPVTPSLAVPSRAEPCLAEPPTRASAPGVVAQPSPLAEGDSLRDALEARWKQHHGTAYAWRRRDEDATRELLALAHGDVAEVLRRWGLALVRTFPLCRGVPDLVAHWNTYGTPDPAAGAGPPGAVRRRGPTRAQDVDQDQELPERLGA